MIIKQRSLIHILKSIKSLNKFLMVLLLIVVIFFFFHLPKVREDDALNISSLNKEEEPLPPKFDHHLLEKGALALSSEIQNFPFPDLSGEVIFLAKNTRPDATLYEIKLHIGLKGSEKTLRVSPGQTVYLTYDQERLNFSKEITPLWIKPCLDESGELWLQMGIHLKDAQGGKVLQEMREFQIKQNWKTKKIKEAVDPQLKTAGDTLKNGKWWAPDKLFEKYGGQEFLQYNGCERLELLLDKGRQILFLNEGETFIWKEGEWIPSVETKGFPMGKVISVTPYKVEWQLWDRGGMESVTLTFNKEKSSVISMRIEDVFTRLRRRTSSRVSCRIDNHATILKEGDWLVHTSTGWREIKNHYEIEALLNLEIQGDLFIFDGLEKIEGKEVFCGTLFNPMRTEEHFVRLPIAHTKNGEHSPPIKNTLSTKIVPQVIEEPLKGPPSQSNSNHKLEPIEECDIFDED